MIYELCHSASCKADGKPRYTRHKMKMDGGGCRLICSQCGQFARMATVSEIHRHQQEIQISLAGIPSPKRSERSAGYGRTFVPPRAVSPSRTVRQSARHQAATAIKKVIQSNGGSVHRKALIGKLMKSVPKNDPYRKDILSLAAQNDFLKQFTGIIK